MSLIVRLNDGLLVTSFQYPAGEWQVRLTALGLEQVRQAKAISVVANAARADDLVRALLLVDAVFHHMPEDGAIDLVVPYLPYGRGDRRFVDGDCFGLRTFCRMVKTAQFQRLVTLDVHSKAAHELYPFIQNKEPWTLIAAARNLVSIANGFRPFTILFPDEGARERYSDMMRAHDGRVLNCTKQRDPETGKLSGFKVPSPDELGTDPVLLIDDICDGGGTFVGIAEQLPLEMRKYLYVTHGIFSKGFEVLLSHFDVIYTSDSLGYELVPSKWASRIVRMPCLPELVICDAARPPRIL